MIPPRDEYFFDLHGYATIPQALDHDHVASINAWIDAGQPLSTLTQISVWQLNDHIQAGLPMQVLDVRESSEWDEGHIDQAHHMSYKQVRQRIDELALQPDGPVSVLCARGMRSSTACSILLMNGYERVHNVTGGMSAWKAAMLPMIDGMGHAVL